jgi:hypothetical protein
MPCAGRRTKKAAPGIRSLTRTSVCYSVNCTFAQRPVEWNVFPHIATVCSYEAR